MKRLLSFLGVQSASEKKIHCKPRSFFDRAGNSQNAKNTKNLLQTLSKYINIVYDNDGNQFAVLGAIQQKMNRDRWELV